MAHLGEQLYDACSRQDHAEVTRLLYAGANKEWRDDRGWTPIICAACCGRLDTVKLLAGRGADIHARTNNGINALMLASYMGKTAVAKFLLDRGVDIHARDNYGRDALLLAALYGCIDTCIMLIGRQADARVTDNQNETALTHFCFHRSYLSAEDKQEGKARLIAAWLAGPHPSQVAERHWQRRKNAVLFLVGSKFRPMQRDAAAAKLAQEQVDKHAKLPGIPRRSKEENLAYLHKEVFGHEGIQRCLVGML